MAGFEYKIELISEEIDYNEFYERFLVKNKPCLLSEKFTRHWKSRNEWVTKDGHPNFEYLRFHFGSAIVPIANCKEKHYNSQLKQEILFAEYLSKWEESIKSKSELHLYLKDWHFVRDFPTYKAYHTPKYFSSDWLNEFWESRKDIHDDYRFVYMGPKGTWTPFHSDVFNSFSWSANICGRKKWFLFPPGQEQTVRDTLGHLAYDITSEELQDTKKYPEFGKHNQRLEFVQEPGQIVFVPSRWHHQVHNIDDTISINHNWLNACNVNMMWHLMTKTLTDVEHEIEDCKTSMTTEEWISHCQVMLKSLAGINFEEFCDMLCMITETRIAYLQSKYLQHQSTSPDEKKEHLKDLTAINSTVSYILDCSESIQNVPAVFLTRMKLLLNKTSDFIDVRK